MVYTATTFMNAVHKLCVGISNGMFLHVTAFSKATIDWLLHMTVRQFKHEVANCGGHIEQKRMRFESTRYRAYIVYFDDETHALKFIEKLNAILMIDNIFIGHSGKFEAI